MKTLRILLIIMAVPAGTLFTLKEVGGSPIYKGDDSGLSVKAERNPAKLVLTNDVGDITCLLRLKISVNAPAYKAQLANGTQLAVNRVTENGENGWIEITDNSSKNQGKFLWPSGTGIFVFPDPPGTGNLQVENWRLFRTDKSPDSFARARWRKIGFVASLVCLVLFLIGGALEVAERLKEKPAPAAAPRPFTAQTLVEAMIQNVVDDKSEERTQWMRLVLTKVVLENIPPLDAITGSPLPEVERKIVYLSAIGKLKHQSETFQQDLARLSARLEQPLFHAQILITGPSEPIRK